MKVKLLNQTHPDYDGPRLERLRALHVGGRAWHDLIGTWLPKRSVEPSDVYTERLALAAYNNHAGPLVSMLSASLFAEAPQVDGVEGDYWAALWGDCDGRGAPWARFWRERLEDAQVGRQAFIWANLPARSTAASPATRADEESAGLLDAYLVGLLPEQVLDWWEDERGRLTGVMVRDTVSRREGPGSPRTTVWRWTYISETTIQRWEWTEQQGRPAPTDSDEAQETILVQHQIGRLPVVRLQLPPGLWTMGKLEDPVTTATRARNELTWALHQAANELLVVTSAWGDEQVNIGHGHFLRLGRDKDGTDTASYTAPSGVAFQYLEADVKNTREEVFRSVQQMALSADGGDAKARLSGESKAEDWRALDIILSSFRDLVLGAMGECIDVIASARKEDSTGVSVSGLDGWQTEDLGVFLEAAALAVDAHQLSPTFRKLLAKREAQRLLQDEVSAEDLQAVLDEIDAAEDDPAPAPPIKRGPSGLTDQEGDASEVE